MSNKLISLNSITKFWSNTKTYIQNYVSSFVNNKLSNFIQKSDIINSFTSTDATKVAAAPTVKTLNDNLNQLNMNLTPIFVSNAVFKDEWSGTLTLIKCGYVFYLYGFIDHNSEAHPEWGQLVCTFTGYTNQYWYPITVFQTGGILINSFAINTNGEIRVYSPDFGNINNASYNTYSVIPNQPLIEKDCIG